MALITKLEKHDWETAAPGQDSSHSGLFTYNLYKDKGITSRLEITLFVNDKEGETDGIKLHSKIDSGKFPEDKIEDIIQKIEDSIRIK